MNDMENWLDPEELDETEKIRMEAEARQIMLEQHEIQIRSAYEAIVDIGIEAWVAVSNHVDRRIRLIDTSLIPFFEEKEEYEKCALLHRMSAELKNKYKTETVA